MSYLVLARKWRPQTFAEVVGQEHVTRTLRNAISSGRVAHAFLFTGPRGVGKTTMARLLAKALNCEHGPAPDPCNTCSNCTEITAGNALDVLEIDGASHTGVENIRDLTEGMQYRPAKSRFRVVIIDEVHMLSNSAFNALLKTLEEPPPHVKFIFATTEANKVLQTILSRCQRYDFKRIPLRELLQRLRLVAEREKLVVDEVGLALLAREADGSLRDAESLLDQVAAWGDGAISEQTVKDALGVADRQALFRLADAVLAQDPAQALRLAGDLYQFGYDPRRLCRDLLEHFRHMTVIKISDDPALLSDLPDHEIAAVRTQIATRSLEDLQRFFTVMLRTEEEIGRTAYTQLVIEMALVKLASQPPVLPIDDALAKLEALYNQLNSDSPPPSPARRGTPQAPPSPSSRPVPSAPSIPIKPREDMVREESPPAYPTESRPIDRQNDSEWDGFLKVVQKEKISLFFALKSSHLLEVTETSLQIGVDKEPYFKELTRKENHALLEEAAQRFFGRSLAVEVARGSTRAPSTPASGVTPEATRGQGTERSGQKEEEDDPLIHTVLEVLGGEVQPTRSRRPASEPAR